MLRKLAQWFVILSAFGLPPTGALADKVKDSGSIEATYVKRDVADAKVIHTYSNELGYEVDQLVAVDMSKLRLLVPDGYTIVTAVSLGLGGPDQGIVVIVNFRGIGPTVDGKKTAKDAQVAIDVGVLVVEPAEAEAAGVNIPGAFHLYTLAIYTDDARYAASLQSTMPVKFLNKIHYQRDIDDATGSGSLIASVPGKSAFFSMSSSEGYVPAPGALNAVFWHDGHLGKAVLHFFDQPFSQGNALSQVYTKPDTRWEALFNGGGLGSCANDPETGYSCIVAPALNLRFDGGTVGRLLLFK